MPHRLVSLAILVGWALAAVALFTRDMLPGLVVGQPPDLRRIAQAEEDSGPTRWAILVTDDAHSPGLRAVGRAITENRRMKNGGTCLISEAWLDSGELLRGTHLESAESERVEFRGAYDIAPSGDLDSFRASVRVGGYSDDLMVINGQVRGNRLEVSVTGPVPLLNARQSFHYQPRGMVQGAIGPIDRMPGLQVGQRWVTKVVGPLTGRVEEVQVEVVGKRLITWDKDPVETLEVVTHMAPMTARTWVRRDGLVLRQEVPFPLRMIYLERLSDMDDGPAFEEPAR